MLGMSINSGDLPNGFCWCALTEINIHLSNCCPRVTFIYTTQKLHRLHLGNETNTQEYISWMEPFHQWPLNMWQPLHSCQCLPSRPLSRAECSTPAWIQMCLYDQNGHAYTQALWGMLVLIHKGLRPSWFEHTCFREGIGIQISWTIATVQDVL